MPKVEKNIPLGQRAYSAIKGMIIKGDLSPNQPVPESVLAKELEISRSPVKAALTRLQEDGFVVAEAWKVPLVAPLDEKYIHNVYQIRMALEAQCALSSAKAIPDGEIEKLARKLEGIGYPAAAEDSPKVFEVFLQMQRLIREYCDNDLLRIMTGKMDDHLERIRNASLHEEIYGFMEADLQMLRGAVAALRRRDAHELARVITDNLEKFRVWILERWARTHGGGA